MAGLHGSNLHAITEDNVLHDNNVNEQMHIKMQMMTLFWTQAHV